MTIQLDSIENKNIEGSQNKEDVISSQLPLEIIFKILSHLPTLDQVKAERVCKTWQVKVRNTTSHLSEEQLKELLIKDSKIHIEKLLERQTCFTFGSFSADLLKYAMNEKDHEWLEELRKDNRIDPTAESYTNDNRYYGNCTALEQAAFLNHRCCIKVLIQDTRVTEQFIKKYSSKEIIPYLETDHLERIKIKLFKPNVMEILKTIKKMEEEYEQQLDRIGFFHS